MSTFSKNNFKPSSSITPESSATRSWDAGAKREIKIGTVDVERLIEKVVEWILVHAPRSIGAANLIPPAAGPTTR